MSSSLPPYSPSPPSRPPRRPVVWWLVALVLVGMWGLWQLPGAVFGLLPHEVVNQAETALADAACPVGQQCSAGFGDVTAQWAVSTGLPAIRVVVKDVQLSVVNNPAGDVTPLLRVPNAWAIVRPWGLLLGRPAKLTGVGATSADVNVLPWVVHGFLQPPPSEPSPWLTAPAPWVTVKKLTIVGNNVTEPMVISGRGRFKAAEQANDFWVKRLQVAIGDEPPQLVVKKARVVENADGVTIQKGGAKLASWELAKLLPWLRLLAPEAVPNNWAVRGVLDGDVVLKTASTRAEITGQLTLTQGALTTASTPVVAANHLSVKVGREGWELPLANVTVLGQPLSLKGAGSFVHKSTEQGLPKGVPIGQLTLAGKEISLQLLQRQFQQAFPDVGVFPKVIGQATGQLQLDVSPNRLTPSGELVLQGLQVSQSAPPLLDTPGTLPSPALWLPTLNATVAITPAVLSVPKATIDLPGGTPIELSASVKDWWQSLLPSVGVNPAAGLHATGQWSEVPLASLSAYLNQLDSSLPDLAGALSGQLTVKGSLSELATLDDWLAATELTLASPQITLATSKGTSVPPVSATQLSAVVGHGQWQLRADEANLFGLGLNTIALTEDEGTVSICPIHTTRLPNITRTVEQAARGFSGAGVLADNMASVGQQLDSLKLCGGTIAGNVNWNTSVMSANLHADNVTGQLPNGLNHLSAKVGATLSGGNSLAVDIQHATANLEQPHFGRPIKLALAGHGQATQSPYGEWLGQADLDSQFWVTPAAKGHLALSGELLPHQGLHLAKAAVTLPGVGTIHARGDVIPADVMAAIGEVTNPPAQVGHIHPEHRELAKNLVATNQYVAEGTDVLIENPAPLVIGHVWTDNNAPLSLAPLTRDWLAPLLPSSSPLLGQPFLRQDNAGSVGVNTTMVARQHANTLLLGQANAHNVKLPILAIDQFTAGSTFDGLDSHVVIDEFAIPGVSIDTVEATIQDTLLYPTHLKNLTAHAGLFDVTAWGYWLDNIVTTRWVHGVSEPLIRPLLPPPAVEQMTPVPVVFYNGAIRVDEAIYDTVLLENLQGQLSIHETGFVELNDVRGNVASGDVALTITADPLNNHTTSVNLDAHQVSANALAVALLHAPNQIFGDIDGTIRFSTQGLTEAEQFAYANGAASFTIANGRLPAIAKIETVLAATNVFRGGLLGLNLNNVLRTLDFTEDNYFTSLSGSLGINEGIATTNDFLSDGENLDLLIEGDIRLADGYSDLTVFGEMNQTLEGGLGWLGRLSLNSVLGKIPGIGFLPFGKHRKGLLAYVPGVGYVPFLGHNGNQPSTRFRVLLEGYLSDAAVVKGFSWERPPAVVERVNNSTN